MESVGTGKTTLANLKNIQPTTVGKLNATQRSVAPSSSQIKAGTDYKNTPLGVYKVVSLVTDENGKGQIFFKDLKEQSEYVVYITASSPLPYEPTMTLPD